MSVLSGYDAQASDDYWDAVVEAEDREWAAELARKAQHGRRRADGPPSRALKPKPAGRHRR